MLKKAHISNIEIHSPEWHKFRLGRFTSSRMSAIMGEDGLSKGGMTYIYQKVGERLTGESNEREIDFDEDLEWGKRYEPEAIEAFGRAMNLKFLVTQKLVADPESQFSSTPDALMVHNECLLDESEYNVSTVEGKCPRTYHRFIPFFLCKTPLDLYKLDKVYFWQTIDQMHQCGAAVGYFFVYHPLFPEGSNLNIITFKQMELWDYFKRLSQRKKEIVQKFGEILSQMSKSFPQMQ